MTITDFYELEFWRKVYVTAIDRGISNYGAREMANKAVKDYREVQNG